jgi:hypothetical protein
MTNIGSFACSQQRQFHHNLPPHHALLPVWSLPASTKASSGKQGVWSCLCMFSMWHRHTPRSVFLSRFGRPSAKCGAPLFLGPGRGGSTPRHGSDVASGFRLQQKPTHRRMRAFDPHARRRPHPGQHRLPPRSHGHEPRSLRGKHGEYGSGLEREDKKSEKYDGRREKSLKRLERIFHLSPQIEILSSRFKTVVAPGWTGVPPSRQPFGPPQDGGDGWARRVGLLASMAVWQILEDSGGANPSTSS